jgi:hypothetical protein
LQLRLRLGVRRKMQHGGAVQRRRAAL